MPGEPLDCRGLACPNPVIKTKELIDRGDVRELTVLVDNPAAQENVGRFLQRAGFVVQVEENQGTFTIHGSRGAAGTCQIMVPEAAGDLPPDPRPHGERHPGPGRQLPGK